MSDQYPTAEMIAGAKALAGHRCMRDGTRRMWADYTDAEKLSVLAEVETVMTAVAILTAKLKT